MNMNSKQQWAEERKSYIGASEVAAVMGLCKYSGPVQVWMEKTGRAETNLDSYRIRKGHKMEEFIIQEARGTLKEMGVNVASAMSAGPDGGDIPPEALTFKSRLHLPLVVHCDAIGTLDAETGFVIEAKCTNSRMTKDLVHWRDKGEPLKNTSTMNWWVQIQAQLSVLEYPEGFLAAD